MPTSDTVCWNKITQNYVQGKYPNYMNSGNTVGPKNWKPISKIGHAADIRIRKSRQIKM